MHRLVPPHVLQLARSGALHDSASGAALIIDAEGSTALSARLQPHGTSGAEAFASILSGIFRPMIEHVVSEQGIVAELAGDGILAVFPGDLLAAVERATDTASGVMAGLHTLAEFDTPDGPATLTVRAAVGYGQIEWVIWTLDDADAPQNAAFSCLGSAVDEARRGEAITPGGTISVGPAAATGLPRRTTATELSNGFKTIAPTRGIGTSQENLESRAGMPSTDLRFYPAELAASDLSGEFRDVVAVFVEIAPQTQTPGDVGIEHLLAALARYRGYLDNVTKPSADSDGIRAFALWGAPTSHEHDIGYALRFLEELRSRHGSGMRAGVTWRSVFTGFAGAEHQEVYTAIGPGVNLAARICDAAAWGEIWTDHNITSRLTHPWGFESLGEFEYRGFSQPVATARVTHVPPVRVAEPEHGSFLGRDRELDRLEDLVAPLWAGRSGGVTVVTGDPGIGKSRLISALEQRLSTRDPAPVWMHARADEIATQPLATLRDALAGYFGRPGLEQSGERLDAYLEVLGEGSEESADELSRTRNALGDLLQLKADVERADKLDPRTRFENLVIAVENLVEAVERTAPVIVSVADGHWMDTGTAEVLRLLVEDLKDKRLAILVETRDRLRGLPHDNLVEVGALDEDIIAVLAHQTLGTPASSALISALSERSGGNPFFAHQLLEYLIRHELVNEPEKAFASLDATSDSPLDMRRLLVARLDGLDGGVRRLVRTASVLGRQVDLQILQQMSAGLSAFEFQTQVEAAIEGGIWDRVDPTHVVFSSLLVRDAAYGMLLHSDARAMHGSAATAIEAMLAAEERRDAELAHHHDRAGNPNTAADYYISAGQTAAHRYDHQQAHLHLDRALDLLGEDDRDRRYQALRLKHDIYEVEGDRPSQEGVISSMEQLVTDGDIPHSIDVALLRGRLLTGLGHYQQALQVIDAAAPLAAGPTFADERGQLVFLKAAIARYQGRSEDAVALAESARNLFGHAGDRLRLAQTDDFEGGIAWENGDFEAAAELHRSAAEIFAAAGHVIEEIRALNNLGTAIFGSGDYSKAREIHRAGADRSREVGYRMGEGDHLDNMGGTAWAVGDLELAIRYYTDALLIRQAMDDAWGIAISKGNLGATVRAMGNPEQALTLYREALEIDQQIGRRRGEAYDLHGIGLCHLDIGRYNLAREALGRSAEIREDLGESHLANESHVACALAMLRSGDSELAADLVETVVADEGSDFFAGAVETTATRLRCVEILEVRTPELARTLMDRTTEGVLERAAKISDPDQRKTYLEQVESHSRAVGNDG